MPNLENLWKTRHFTPCKSWAYHFDEPKGKQPVGRVEPGANLLNASETKTKAFLAQNCGKGRRPGSVAGHEGGEGIVYGATAYPDVTVADSVAQLHLTEDELKQEARARAAVGFVPTSLTGYHTKDGGTRFCAVWVKYTPPKK